MIKRLNIDNVLTNMIYMYIILPVMIFLLGWCEWFIAIPGVLVLLVCFIKICKDSDKRDFCFSWNKNDLEKVIFIIGIIALWVYFSGVGGFVNQNSDHTCRNAVFEMLVDYDWPVVSELILDGTLQTRGLVYYIGFWLPSAVVGKLLGMRIGYCFQAIWAVLGICLFYYLVCVFRKKIEIWPLVVFVFMSGLDIFGYYIFGGDMGALDGTNHIEWWSSIYQFSSFTTQLFWVFNQAISAWLILMLMHMQKNNRHIVLILGCALLPSTLPFIGMLPFFLYYILSRRYEDTAWGSKEWWKFFYKDTFTFENILGGGIAGIISFVYLSGNISGQNIESTTDDKSTLGYLMIILVFIIVEVGIYWLAIYKYHKKNPLFYIMMGWFCLCPWIRVGSKMDFCMRASIPALILLYLFIITALDQAYMKKEYISLIAIIAFLLVGSVTATNEINRTISTTKYEFENDLSISGERRTDEVIFGAANFSGNVDNSIFFKYFAAH